ncbi:murein biosynthesis integral membrane protein MurJ [bacterium]|nr:murein biosynthesis integral membrane protein MurJ [bacterium]
MKREGKITRSVAGVSASTLASRILGYLRDMLIANFFGAGFVADAFFVAYRIPNLLRQLLGEGALSASFIPVFTEYLTTKPKEEAQRLVRISGLLLLILLSILTILGIIFSPIIVRLIAPGFIRNPEKLSLTITLTRILFPFMIAIGLAALSLGILNSLHRFIIPALAPCLLSISEIFFILFICPLMERPIIGLALGVAAGGFAQFFFQLPSIVKEGFVIPAGKSYSNPHLKPISYAKNLLKNCNVLWKRWTSTLDHPGVKKIGLLMLPATLGLSVTQVNTFLDTICASVLREGSVTALYYANRIMQLPLALFGTAIATVALPMMSRSVAATNMQELKDTLSLALRMILFTIVPASLGLIILGKPIISLLFERGRFTSQATQSTNWALLFYSTGIVAYAGVKVVASAFYSMQDTRTPVRIASIAMVANIVLNLILMRILDVGGLALATAIASFMNLLILLFYLRKRIGRLGGKRVLLSLAKILLASSAMAIACIYSSRLLGQINKLIQVAGTILICVTIYILVTHLLRCEEIKYVWKIITRKESTDEV